MYYIYVCAYICMYEWIFLEMKANQQSKVDITILYREENGEEREREKEREREEERTRQLDEFDKKLNVYATRYVYILCASIHTRTHTRTHTLTHTRTRMHTHKHTHTHAHTHTNTRTHPLTNKQTNTHRAKEWYGWHFPELDRIVGDNITYARYAHIYTHVHTYIHTYIRTYTYIRTTHLL